MNDTSLFAQNLKDLRIAKGLKQSEFCKSFSQFIGRSTVLPISTLSSWEIGKKRPKYETILKLADYFSISVDQLIGNSPYTGIETQGSSIPSGNVLVQISTKELSKYDGKPILIKYSDALEEHSEWAIYNSKKNVFRCSDKVFKNSPFLKYFSFSNMPF